MMKRTKRSHPLWREWKRIPLMKKIIGIIFVLSLSTIAHAKSIESVNLLKIFSLDKTVDYNAYDWATGAGKSSPIEWLHSGIKLVPDDKKLWYSFYRDGRVVVTNNGKVTHTILDKKVENGYWYIRLEGARNGYSQVEISPNAFTYDEPSFEIDGKYIEETKECAEIDDIYFYRIKFKNKKPFWLKCEYSGGSAGGSTSYTIIFNDDPKCNY